MTRFNQPHVDPVCAPSSTFSHTFHDRNASFEKRIGFLLKEIYGFCAAASLERAEGIVSSFVDLIKLLDDSQWNETIHWLDVQLADSRGCNETDKKLARLLFQIQSLLIEREQIGLYITHDGTLLHPLRDALVAKPQFEEWEKKIAHAIPNFPSVMEEKIIPQNIVSFSDPNIWDLLPPSPIAEDTLPVADIAPPAYFSVEPLVQPGEEDVPLDEDKGETPRVSRFG